MNKRKLVTTKTLKSFLYELTVMDTIEKKLNVHTIVTRIPIKENEVIQLLHEQKTNMLISLVDGSELFINENCKVVQLDLIGDKTERYEMNIEDLLLSGVLRPLKGGESVGDK